MVPKVRRSFLETVLTGLVFLALAAVGAYFVVDALDHAAESKRQSEQLEAIRERDAAAEGITGSPAQR